MKNTSFSGNSKQLHSKRIDKLYLSTRLYYLVEINYITLKLRLSFMMVFRSFAKASDSSVAFTKW